MPVSLRRAAAADIKTLWMMQVEAFSGLLLKYRDYDTSPGAESLERVQAKFDQPGTIYYFIMDGETTVGGVRVVDKRDGSRKRIAPVWIMPEHRRKGYARAAFARIEEIHGADSWSLDTILQEEGNVRLYEQLGYRRTGETRHIKDGMDIVFFEKD